MSIRPHNHPELLNDEAVLLNKVEMDTQTSVLAFSFGHASQRAVDTPPNMHIINYGLKLISLIN